MIEVVAVLLPVNDEAVEARMLGVPEPGPEDGLGLSGRGGKSIAPTSTRCDEDRLGPAIGVCVDSASASVSSSAPAFRTAAAAVLSSKTSNRSFAPTSRR